MSRLKCLNGRGVGCPRGVIPFVCGSLAGVTSWALIYPIDVSRLIVTTFETRADHVLQAIKVRLLWGKALIGTDIRHQTKAQQRALSGLPRRTPLVQFLRMARGPDKDNPKPLLRGITRIYRGFVLSLTPREILLSADIWHFLQPRGLDDSLNADARCVMDNRRCCIWMDRYSPM